MANFLDEYVALVRVLKARRQHTCVSCQQLFDPEANIPSVLARPGLCPTCESEDLNLLADRLQEDIPGSRKIFCTTL